MDEAKLLDAVEYSWLLLQLYTILLYTISYIIVVTGIPLPDLPPRPAHRESRQLHYLQFPLRGHRMPAVQLFFWPRGDKIILSCELAEGEISARMNDLTRSRNYQSNTTIVENREGLEQSVGFQTAYLVSRCGKYPLSGQEFRRCQSDSLWVGSRDPSDLPH